MLCAPPKPPSPSPPSNTESERETDEMMENKNCTLQAADDDDDGAALGESTTEQQQQCVKLSIRSTRAFCSPHSAFSYYTTHSRRQQYRRGALDLTSTSSLPITSSNTVQKSPTMARLLMMKPTSTATKEQEKINFARSTSVVQQQQTNHSSSQNNKKAEKCQMRRTNTLDITNNSAPPPPPPFQRQNTNTTTYVRVKSPCDDDDDDYCYGDEGVKRGYGIAKFVRSALTTLTTTTTAAAAISPSEMTSSQTSIVITTKTVKSPTSRRRSTSLRRRRRRKGCDDDEEDETNDHEFKPSSWHPNTGGFSSSLAASGLFSTNNRDTEQTDCEVVYIFTKNPQKLLAYIETALLHSKIAQTLENGNFASRHGMMDTTHTATALRYSSTAPLTTTTTLLPPLQRLHSNDERSKAGSKFTTAPASGGLLPLRSTSSTSSSDDAYSSCSSYTTSSLNHPTTTTTTNVLKSCFSPSRSYSSTCAPPPPASPLSTTTTTSSVLSSSSSATKQATSSPTSSELCLLKELVAALNNCSTNRCQQQQRRLHELLLKVNCKTNAAAVTAAAAQQYYDDDDCLLPDLLSTIHLNFVNSTRLELVRFLSSLLSSGGPHCFNSVKRIMYSGGAGGSENSVLQNFFSRVVLQWPERSFQYTLGEDVDRDEDEDLDFCCHWLDASVPCAYSFMRCAKLAAAGTADGGGGGGGVAYCAADGGVDCNGADHEEAAAPLANFFKTSAAFTGESTRVWLERLVYRCARLLTSEQQSVVYMSNEQMVLLFKIFWLIVECSAFEDEADAAWWNLFVREHRDTVLNVVGR